MLSISEINNITDDIVSYDMRPEDTEVYVKYIRPLPPESVVIDVGTGEAKNAIRMALANPDAEVWTWDWGEKHSMPKWRYYKMIMDRAVAHGAMNLYFTIADSDKAWPDWKRPVSVLNIDASHDYEQTIKDLTRWEPFVVGGGYIFIHDYEYEGGNLYKFEDLRRAVQEYCTKDKFQFFEYKGGTQVIQKL